MQVHSSQFLQKYEDVKNERIRLFDELPKHQIDSIHEREQTHKQHIKELEEAQTQFSQRINRVTEEAAGRVKSINTSCELLTTKLQLDIDKAKQEMLALQTMYDKREEHINVLVMKLRQKLNRKVEETLAAAWNQWSATNDPRRPH